MCPAVCCWAALPGRWPITLTVPDALEVIEALSRDDDLAARGAVVGAGTVLTAAQADAALGAGARFLVSPVFFPELVARAHAAGQNESGR